MIKVWVRQPTLPATRTRARTRGETVSEEGQIWEEGDDKRGFLLLWFMQRKRRRPLGWALPEWDRKGSGEGQLDRCQGSAQTGISA